MAGAAGRGDGPWVIQRLTFRRSIAFYNRRMNGKNDMEAKSPLGAPVPPTLQLDLRRWIGSAIDDGMTTEQALAELRGRQAPRIGTPPPTIEPPKA